MNGIDGIILFPDDFFENRVNVAIDYNKPDCIWTNNIYDKNVWDILEGLKAVFLPCKYFGSSFGWVYETSTIAEIKEDQVKVYAAIADVKTTRVEIGTSPSLNKNSIRLIQEVI